MVAVSARKRTSAPRPNKLTAKERAAQELRAWHASPEGVAAYRAALMKAQLGADTLGMDHGLAFDGHLQGGRLAYGGWHTWPLPAKQYRFGADHTCAVIYPTYWQKTKPGHGSSATRPPSTVGPAYHGGPFNREEALAAARAWEAEHGPLYPTPTPEQRAAEAEYVAKLDRVRYGVASDSEADKAAAE